MSAAFQADIKKDVSSSWFKKTFQAEIVATFRPTDGKKISAATLALFLEQLLKQFPPLPFFQSHSSSREPAVIRNIRGRPPETFVGQPVSHDQATEELFFLSGVFVDTADQSQPQPDTNVPLRYTIASKFHEFEGSANIVHSVSALLQSPIADHIQEPSALALTRLVPLRITRARIGFEFFHSRYFGAWLGITPDIYGRCYIEVEPGQIQINITDERLPSRSSLPFAEHGTIEALDQSLRVSSISDQFRERLMT